MPANVRAVFKFVAVIAFALTGWYVANAQQERTVDPALKKAADARTTARDTADGDTYGRYTLEDAWLVSPNGGFRLTKQNVDDLKAIKVALVNPKVSEERYRMVGDGAIRTYRRDLKDPQGQKAAVRFLESWVKQAGEWKLAAEWYRTIPEP
jgi:hypothetical protein